MCFHHNTTIYTRGEWCLSWEDWRLLFRRKMTEAGKWVWVLSLDDSNFALGYFKLLLYDKSKGWIIHTNIVIRRSWENIYLTLWGCEGEKHSNWPVEQVTLEQDKRGGSQRRQEPESSVALRFLTKNWIWNVACRQCFLILKLACQSHNLYLNYRFWP